MRQKKQKGLAGSLFYRKIYRFIYMYLATD